MSSESEQGRLFLRIPGKPEYVSLVRLTISGLASRVNDLSYEDIEDLKLAVAEACSRAILHGNGEEISIECQVSDHSVTVSIQDQGTGEEEEDDMGIFLIRSLMEEVTIKTLAGKGSILSMSKKRDHEHRNQRS